MASTNKKSVVETPRLAGGFGAKAARQSNEQELRRLVLSCLLWEDIAYASGNEVTNSIKAIIPKIDPQVVADIAVEARFQQKLRHVPLLLCREMLRYETHRGLVAKTLAKVIHRPDELSEFVSIYWKDGKKMLPRQAKLGLGEAFNKFNEYQLAKWNRKKDIMLRDVLFLAHAKPKNDEQASLFMKLINDELAVPDTWEVGLSAARSAAEKKEVWERLLEDKVLGALAFLKNLRNMEQVGVSKKLIGKACRETISPSMLLPVDFIKAAKHAPEYMREIEDLMYRCTAQFPKLAGSTVFVVDVSGSMGARISAESEFTRMSVAAAMCVLAAEMCEDIAVYATAGSDYAITHKTERIKPHRGFALSDNILETQTRLGGGGIFTRQCLEYIKKDLKETPDRIVVFSDSQDMDGNRTAKPKPFAKHNYICDVSSHRHGVNYQGVWTAEISGWSENFLRYIASIEANGN